MKKKWRNYFRKMATKIGSQSKNESVPTEETVPVKTRKKWLNYFMEMATIVGGRSTCDRAFVGAVIVDEENRVIATGYNGSAGSGIEHCLDVGHTMRDGHCIATVHAEQNAIADCARSGKSTKNATIYVTHFPCLHCTKLIIASGIRKVVFNNAYRIDDYAFHLLKANRIEVLWADTEDASNKFELNNETQTYTIK